MPSVGPPLHWTGIARLKRLFRKRYHPSANPLMDFQRAIVLARSRSMVLPNESLQNPALAKAFNFYMAKAREEMQKPDFVYSHDPHEILRVAEKTTNLLAVAAQRDKTPELLVIDEHAPATWGGLFDAQLHEAYPAFGGAAVVGSSKSARGRETTPTLARSLDNLDSVRRRLTTSINGNNAQSAEAKELRAVIYGSRTFYRSRADYETEYELVVAALRELEKKEKAPNGVRRMLPLVESALTSLKSLAPTAPGRQRAPLEIPPVEVQLITIAMHLALGDLLSHASSTATDSRLNALSKAINARRAGVVGSIDPGHQDAGEDFGIEEPVVPAPVEETGIVVVSPGPVASGEAGTVDGGATGLVNGEADGEVAAVVAEAVRERRGRHGRRGE